MPPLVFSIIGYIQLAMKAAPEVKAVYDEGKALIDELFKQGLITADQQNALNQWADAHMAARLAGQTPPEFDVQKLAPAPAYSPVVL